MRKLQAAWMVGLGCLLVVAIGACGGGTASGSPATEFQVAHVSPPDGFVLQDQPSVVYLVFSRPVDERTVSGRSIRVVAEDGHDLRGEARVRSMTPTTVEFRLEEELRRGHRYTIIASTELRDHDGNVLASPHFSVIALASPGTSTPTPGPGAPPTVPCPTPAGRTIYHARHSVTVTGAEVVAYDSEGGGQVGFLPGTIRAASYRLHDCRRWFIGWIVAGVTAPNGKSAHGIRAFSDAGDSVDLLPPNSNRHVVAQNGLLRWAKDDSFISFVAIDFDGPSPQSALVRLPVAWKSGAPEALPEKELRLLTADPLPKPAPQWQHLSEIHLFDWSPSGNEVVYSVLAPGSTGAGYALRIYDLATDQSRFLAMGYWPRWSAVGSDSTAPIAFQDYRTKPVGPGVFTILPDGSGETRVTPAWTSAPGQQWRFSPVWSPDGLRLALVRTEQDLAVSQPRTWSVEVLDLATLDLVEIDKKQHDHFELLVGWR